jgi:hypothetical protein
MIYSLLLPAQPASLHNLKIFSAAASFSLCVPNKWLLIVQLGCTAT